MKKFEINDIKKEQMKEVVKRNGFEKTNTSWMALDVGARTHIYSQGWKVHITTETPEEFIRGIEVLGPEIERLKLQNKIMNIDNFIKQNEYKIRDNAHFTDMQKGKDIVLYLEDLTILQELSDEAKNFISEPVEDSVLTDINIGGRVNVRYTGYSHDYAIGINGEIAKTNRDTPLDSYLYGLTDNEIYKPPFIENPPTLEEVLTMDRTKHETKYEAHKEDFVGYLIRTGYNNELLKEIFTYSPKDFIAKSVDGEDLKSIANRQMHPAYDYINDKNIGDVVFQSNNEEMKDYLTNLSKETLVEVKPKEKYENTFIDPTREESLAAAYTFVKTLPDNKLTIFRESSNIRLKYSPGLEKIENETKIRTAIHYLEDEMKFDQVLTPKDHKFILEEMGIKEENLREFKEYAEKRSEELENIRFDYNTKQTLKISISIIEDVLNTKEKTTLEEVLPHLNKNQIEKIELIEKIKEYDKDKNKVLGVRQEFYNEADVTNIIDNYELDEVEELEDDPQLFKDEDLELDEYDPSMYEDEELEYDPQLFKDEDLELDEYDPSMYEDEELEDEPLLIENDELEDEIINYIDLEKDISLIMNMENLEESKMELTNYINKYVNKNNLDEESVILKIDEVIEENFKDNEKAEILREEITERYEDIYFMAMENVKSKDYYTELDKTDIEIANLIEKSRLAIYDRSLSLEESVINEFKEKVVDEILLLSEHKKFNLEPKELSKKIDNILNKEYKENYKEKMLDNNLERKDKDIINFMTELKKEMSQVQKTNTFDIQNEKEKQKEI